MSKKIVHELFLLRSMACLSILFLHCLARVYGDGNDAVNYISILLTFGTPMFVFISEFILSYSYPEQTPSQFWPKRLKYLLLPYLLFGTFYAFVKAVEQSIGSGADTIGATFLSFWWKHILLGDYHGYFILIIFQFYLLHMWFQKYGKRYSPKWVLGVSFVANIGYLAFFNFTNPFNGSFAAEYIWYKGYWLPFVGWVFYFTLAYYAGRHYAAFRAWLAKYSVWVVIAPFAIAVVPYFLYRFHVLTDPSSKRIDMLFFTVSVIFLLYWIALRLRSIPKIFVWISRYSFGIYLLHPLFLGVLAQVPQQFKSIHPILQTIILFVVCILLSALTVYVAVKIPFGQYVIGRIGAGDRPDKTIPLDKKQDALNAS